MRVRVRVSDMNPACRQNTRRVKVKVRVRVRVRARVGVSDMTPNLPSINS